MDNILVEMTALGSVAIALFGAAFCVMQTRHSRISRTFAVFLLAIALNNMPDAFIQMLAMFPRSYGATVDFITMPSSFLLAPLFWLYVHVLTAPDQQMPTRLARHFALPAVAVLAAILVLLSPVSLRVALVGDELEPNSAWGMSLGVLVGLLHIAVFPQIALYLVLIIRRLSEFRLTLREYYSSTERYELRWIYIIGGLGFSFWLTMVLVLFATVGFGETPPWVEAVASLAGFVLVSALTLWGIRQRPPLAPDAARGPAQTDAHAAGKYEKSALSPEASDRLSRKLRRAMEVDHLHRDPNLSLWALARHTGASSNYISQTLNEVMGESFFDFVNSYRIAEAKTLLATTDASVLTITYDVGFNARSSFYNAFKRHTGQTPTNFRKELSQRDGLDDMNGQLGDT
ncbi:helix-turn-helix domain-containing protein [Primorskyibacter sp. S187A]|uniref:helix-turn-helix domain-containing protein n=1 Tax=Primorskyibacter sp. S187A TaxID=3415130 RepID=UPI003C7E2D93